jgi:hypothetical protein
MEFYSVIKKNRILSFAGKWMELEIIMLNELNQTQKLRKANLACFLKYVESR